VVAIAPHVYVEHGRTDVGIRAAGEAYARKDDRLRRALYRAHARPDDVLHAWHDTWLSPAFADWNVTSDCATIRVPVVAAQGDNDEYFFMSQVDALATAAHRAASFTRIVLRSCGHNPFPTHTPQLVDIIARTHAALAWSPRVALA